MTVSNRLGITELGSSQVDRSVTVNEAIAKLEAGATCFAAISIGDTAPPGSPAEGDLYVLGASPTGAWSGQGKYVAVYYNAAWFFLPPIEGALAYAQDDNAYYFYSGSAWALFAGGGGGGVGDVVGPASSTDGHFAQFDLATGKLLKDGGLALDTDGTLAANSDTKLASQKAVKTYIDGLALNLGKRGRVRAATTANITILTDLNNGDTLDGLTLATGEWVLVKDQSSPAENGVYSVGVVPARVSDFDEYDEYPGSLIAVEEGTVSADTLWLCTSNAGGTINVTAINFSQFVLSADPAPPTHAATSKVTPVDNDELPLVDSAASNVLKKLLWSNVKATLKTYFDTLYAAGSGTFTPASTTEVLTGTDTAKGVTPDALAALWEKGADVASATTVSLGEGGYFHITGTTTITDIDWATAKDGRVAWVIFDGILTLTQNSTTLKLPGGANITTAAGDRACFVQDASDNVICLLYLRADGSPLNSTVLRSSVSANLTAGYTATGYSAGTKSSGTFTPDPANGNLQYATNGGAHTLAPPSTGSGDALTMVIEYTNNGSAGTITTSGFTKVTGDALTTTNTSKFILYLAVINSISHLNVVAMQ